MGGMRWETFIAGQETEAMAECNRAREGCGLEPYDYENEDKDCDDQPCKGDCPF